MTPDRRVLIVDDDALIGQHLSETLTDHGYAPVVFRSGTEFLSHLRQHPENSLTLLDITMPGMTGVEVMREIAAMAVRPAIIVMTGHANTRLALECLELGARDYITKPLDLDLLLFALRRVAERERLDRAQSEQSRLAAMNLAGVAGGTGALRRLSEILRVQSVPGDFPLVVLEVLRITHDALRSQASSITVQVNNRHIVHHLPSAQHIPAGTAAVEQALAFAMETGTGLIHGMPARGNGHQFPVESDLFAGSVILPLRAGAGCFGAVHVSRPLTQPRFTDAEMELLELICAEVAVLRTNASLCENYEKMTIGAIAALANAINVMDGQTGEHSKRTEQILLRMIDRLGLPRGDRDLIVFAMRLHDIGKIRVPNTIINKPGPLDDDEWAIMRQHPIWGFEILQSDGMLTEIARIVRHHHERYDGSGYPDGLKGKSIPLGSRILSVVDAFDAMRSNRPYRKALPFTRAVEEIRSNIGTQFDPDIALAFLDSIAQSSTLGGCHEPQANSDN
ncbi:MAG: response regulator [Candidatus Sumerlaeaceae bacterium]|nr:response regulator [Candidatus Sumerlaeaceae bacterium]